MVKHKFSGRTGPGTKTRKPFAKSSPSSHQWGAFIFVIFSLSKLSQHLEQKRKYFQRICFKCGIVYYWKTYNSTENEYHNHIIPSTWGGQSAWSREDSIRAFPRIKLRDILPKSWLVTTLSSFPFFRARAEAIFLTWVTAPAWKPPSVSMAIGRKTSPSRRQASAVSLSFLWQAFPK